MKRMEKYEDNKKNLALRMMALSTVDPVLYEELLGAMPADLSEHVKDRVEGLKILFPLEGEAPMQSLAKYAESNG